MKKILALMCIISFLYAYPIINSMTASGSYIQQEDDFIEFVYEGYRFPTGDNGVIEIDVSNILHYDGYAVYVPSIDTGFSLVTYSVRWETPSGALSTSNILQNEISKIYTTMYSNRAVIDIYTPTSFNAIVEASLNIQLWNN